MAPLSLAHAWLALLSLTFLRLTAVSAADITATFTNGNNFIFDTDGNAIDSTSGKIDFLNGTYVWYGLSFACAKEFCGILSYSSPDLVHWENNGFLFDPNTTEIANLCGGSLTGNCGRPHIVYNEADSEYVLWVNAQAPGYALFTSKSATSGYVPLAQRALVGVQGPATMAGDFSVEVINGTGYLAYSLLDFTKTGASIWPPFLQSIYVQELTADLKNTTGDAFQIMPVGDLVDNEAESPDIWQRGDYFYVTASNTCGFCTGTILIVYRSTSIQGPWQRQIISADTCNGQTTAVLTLPSSSGGPTTYLHQADTFGDSPGAITGIRTGIHGHDFQPLSFNWDGSVQDIDCTVGTQKVISLAPGNSTATEGTVLAATDGSGETDQAYQVVCDLPQNQLYQTWASSASGSLTSVGFNMAANSASGNLSVTVFRYSNNTNFFTPRYVWETLATVNFLPTDLTASMAVLQVPISNVTVAVGDRLGIALVNGGITPMCHPVKTDSNVMFDVDTSTRTLFANGIGQVSLRGKQGDTVPVKVMPGAEIKWYATVV
ncbi:hypothetical protein BP6252_01678 [Coleophoma cylindrospora]|uniref:Glycosyl hydrolase family 43 protein n=1 Tax=Coleophoma cylindrospora TaxID=1849047 RepID=A0A3D8STM3_9HELO|nr:hypothetical protein BP6252_01678 [Coleophoma cylindrospora]